MTYFLLAGDHQLPPLSRGDHRRTVMGSSFLPCVVQSCAGASPRALFRSSSSRDGHGHGQTPPAGMGPSGRVSMTPPSSLGRHRKQQSQQPGESRLIGDSPQRRLAAPPLLLPPSGLTVPVAGEWLERGAGRSPDLPVVHYCNANIAPGSGGSRGGGGSVDGGCIHIRGMSESSVSTSTSPVQPRHHHQQQQQRRRQSSSGDVATSPSSPAVSQPGWSPALLRDGVSQGKVLQRVGESPNESRASRRVVDTETGPYDIDAIMQELAVDVERIVDSTPFSGRDLVDQSVQTSNLGPAAPTASAGHHRHHAAFTRAAADRAHLPLGGAVVDRPLKRTTTHAGTSSGMQPPLGAVKFTSVREPTRPMNLIKTNGIVCNNFAASNNIRHSFAAGDHPGVRAPPTNNQVKTKTSPPPLPPPPAHETRQPEGQLLQHRQGASAFKPVLTGANNRSFGLQMPTNNADAAQSHLRVHPLAARPVPGVSQPTAEPQPVARRRGAADSSFRVRRSVCVASLPRLCRSLENIPSDVDDSGPHSRSSSRADSPAVARPRRTAATTSNHHQLLLLHPDDVSLSSFDGTASEMSRSDPALSSYGDTSEYDNYRPGMASDEDYFVPEPISDVDIDLFDDVDVDNVEVSDTYAALDSVGIPPLRRRVVDDV